MDKPMLNPTLPLRYTAEVVCEDANKIDRNLSSLLCFPYNVQMEDIPRAIRILFDTLVLTMQAAAGDPVSKALMAAILVNHSTGATPRSLMAAGLAAEPGLPPEFAEALRKVARGEAGGVYGAGDAHRKDGPFRIECACGCAAEAATLNALAMLLHTWEYRAHGRYVCPACVRTQGTAHAVQEQGAAALHVRESPGDGQGVRGAHGLQEAAGEGQGQAVREAPTQEG